MSKPSVSVGVATRQIAVPPLGLPGIVDLPAGARGLVVFVHGSGSSRLSPRNRAVAAALNARGFATLLFDLLTEAEEPDRANVFDIALLAERLAQAIAWVDGEAALRRLPLGLFGASTGAAAALVAAARLKGRVGAIVSRGGRPDLADAALDRTTTPTLLIVGGNDFGVIELNEAALARFAGPKEFAIVPGATHLFPEPGALEAVAERAARWFERYLAVA
ncbi:MAG: alpha/beta fold hydrolase [Roseiarcus sp.]|jgi:pimeloyl-ACP methyl ester carboxylesterase